MVLNVDVKEPKEVAKGADMEVAKELAEQVAFLTAKEKHIAKVSNALQWQICIFHPLDCYRSYNFFILFVYPFPCSLLLFE